MTPRTWNFLLALVGAVIVAGSAYSAYYLVRQLAREERDKVAEWAQAQRYLQTMSAAEAEVCDVSLYENVLQGNTTVPMVLVAPSGEIIGARNFGERRDADSAYLAARLREAVADGAEPITGGTNAVYYFESNLLRALRFFPVIQLALIATFVGLGYFAVTSVRRAEQNRVWVGMAKETAHQLGTPISAIMAWVEFLRAEYADDEEIGGVAGELERDVERLQLVAERFNKIGSAPDLSPVPVGEVVGEVYHYMSARTPRHVDFTLAVPAEAAGALVAVNRHLFAWVLENLLRNALDAMDGRGELRLAATLDGEAAEITVTDSGKGIPPGKRKAVFRPGYTTKQRGWGLGLSLAKRIVEDYHGGKVFVKDSAVGRGSTFAVRLPVAPPDAPSPT